MVVRKRNGQPGEVTSQLAVEHLSRPLRTRRAFRAGAMIWGLAIAAVFIPIAHFVLVPIGLLAGPIAFYVTLGADALVVPSEVACPECRAPVQVERKRERWPLFDLCKKCHTEIEIAQVEPS